MPKKIQENMLTLITELEEKHKSHGYFGLFQCQCGNIVKKLMYSVINNHTKSCGCINNNKIRSSENQKCSKCGQCGHNQTTCRRFEKKCCVCRNIKSISEFYKNGQGSLKSYCKFCTNKKDNYRHVTNLRFRLSQLLGSAKWRAKQRGYEFDLSLNELNDIYNKQNAKCPYTGFDLKLDRGHEGLSLDRIKPEKGYTKDNVVLTSWKINQMKTDLTLENFVKTCKQIITHMEKSNEFFIS